MMFGLPKVITSDQGGEFHNNLDDQLMAMLGIDHRLSTPYHPQVRILMLNCEHIIVTCCIINFAHSQFNIYYYILLLI